VQAAQPVTGSVRSPREPGQQEGQRVEGRAVQDGEAAVGAERHAGVVLEVTEERVVHGVPDHVHDLVEDGKEIHNDIIL